jgi:hypothetical protein
MVPPLVNAVSWLPRRPRRLALTAGLQNAWYGL